MAVNVPGHAYADAVAADAELAPLLLAIAYYESTWNPGAIGDGGASFGYLQFYTRGGLGDGYPPAVLLDGPTNMRMGASEIRRRLGLGQSLYQAIQPWSTRDPAYQLYERMLAEGMTVDGTPIGGAPEPAYPSAPGEPGEPGEPWFSETRDSTKTVALVGAAAVALLAVIALS